MARRVKHGTLTAGSVTTVTLSENWPRVEVMNRGGGSAIFFNVDAGTITPTLNGDDCFVLPAGVKGAAEVESQGQTAAQTVVKLISGGAEEFSVTGI